VYVPTAFQDDLLARCFASGRERARAIGGTPRNQAGRASRAAGWWRRRLRSTN